MYNLLQINSTANAGSTGRIAEDIGILVKENGWNSFIAYGRMANPSKSNLIRVGTKWDVYKHVLTTRLLDKHCFGSIVATRKFIDEIEQIRPDIIHLHNIHGYYLNIDYLFNYLSKVDIPVVWTLHDCWSFTGHCAYFDYVGCEKWKSECSVCPQKRGYPSSLFLDNSLRNFQNKKELFTSIPNLTLVPVSNWLGDLVGHSFLSGYPRRVIHNGINTTLFSPRKSDILEKYNLQDSFVILGVASVWSKRKGLMDFIKISERIDARAKILLIGLSNRQMSNLPKNIIGIGKTESIDELASFYSLADIFVNPTWEEVFGLTNIEAMSCGTPVLTYRTGGSIESVNERVGFIVEKGDIDGVINIIENMMITGKEKFSQDCRENILENFDSNKRYLDYFKLYKNLINNSHIR